MDNKDNRVTIQVDLNGYSFNSTYGEFTGASHLDVVLDTPLYTLIPTKMVEDRRELLSIAHPINENDKVDSIEFPQHEATLIYSIPNDIVSHFSLDKGEVEVIVRPSVGYLIDNLKTISDHNKLLVRISEGHTHIVAAEGEALKLVNSYETHDFVTSLYYIFMVLKEMMFNPEFTTLYLFNEVDGDKISILKKYFKGVETLQINSNR